MRLSRLLAWFFACTLVAAPAAATNDEASVFNETVWQNSALLTQVTGMAWAPDGSHRLFAIRKNGTIAIIKDGALLTSGAALATWATMNPIYTQSECGLIGIAFHPDFVENHYVYLFVTVASNEQQIQRWIDDPVTSTGTFDSVIVPGLPTLGVNHDGGSIGFGRDGKLYWAIGDNGSGVGVNDDYSTYAAKVGRANDDGTLPLDNPFYDGAGPHKDYLWARGFRNPFTMMFRPATGDLWLDVVGNSWEQIFVVGKGGHGGWNNLENNQPTGFLTPAIVYRTNQMNMKSIAAITRSSGVVTVTTTAAHGYRRGNFVDIGGVTDASFDGHVLITDAPTLTTFTYAQAGADASSSLGSVTLPYMGGAVGGGAFYESTLFPPEYWGDFFFGDYNSGNFFRAKPEATTVESVYQWAHGLGHPLDVTVGPDGALYVHSFEYAGTGTIYRTAPIAAATGPIVTPTNLWLLEGKQAAFDVVLPAAPAGDTMLAVMRTSGSTDVSVVEGATLTFTTGNWNVPQRVVLQAAADADREPDVAVFTVSGGTLTSRTLTAYVIDAAPPTFYAYASPLTLNEGGTAMLSIGLTEAATSDVTVTIGVTGDSDVTSESAEVVFTPGDGTSPKTIVIDAASDLDATDDSATVTLTAAGYTPKSIPVTVKDGVVAAPAFTSVAPTTVVVSHPYTYDANASGVPAPSYSLLDGPSGMTIDSATGVVSYTPDTPGSFAVQIQAENTWGTVVQSYTLMVLTDPPPLDLATVDDLAEALDLTAADLAADDLTAADDFGGALDLPLPSADLAAPTPDQASMDLAPLPPADLSTARDLASVTPGLSGGGCGCQTSDGPTSLASLVALALLLAGLRYSRASCG